MNIKDYVKKYNIPFEKLKSDFKSDFNSLFEYEKEWLGHLEDKLHLLKNEKHETAIKDVIKKLKNDVSFNETDTSNLSTFVSKINTIVRIANRINNYKEGTSLNNNETLSLYHFFNAVRTSNNLKEINYNLNDNLNNFLPHIYSVIKHCQRPDKFPIYYKYWKNIMREVLSKNDEYDSMCLFYRTFSSTNRHLNFGTYLGVIGIQIAKNIKNIGTPLTKDSRDYKYLIKDVINIKQYKSILDENLGIAIENNMDNYKIVNEFISKLKASKIKAANSIKSLITSDDFENNLKIIDRIFFNSKLQEIDSNNYVNTISFIMSIHKIKSGEYNDFNIWSASKTHLNKTNKNLIERHDELNEIVGFPDNGNGLYKSFLGDKNLLAFIKDKFKAKSDTIENSKPKTTQLELSEKFQKVCKASGLRYTPELITRYISSLATKPFVLLSGLSGSGKTKLAEAFAKWICKSEEQYALIPVGADWTNREPLLGYPNALKDSEYVKPDNDALDLLLRAKDDETRPYFLILDEMNLSHVERYFADFLSTMESDNVIPLHKIKNEVNKVPPILKLPKNLFIVGTVNIDETTYMFSPKVLDRANTIEFRVKEDEIKDFLEKPNAIDLNKLESAGASMATNFVTIATKKEDYQLSVDQQEEVHKFFKELQKSGAEFGYRTAFEISKLIFKLKEFGLDNNDVKTDIAIMQKMLPKLHGSRTKLARTLKPLAKLCLDTVDDDTFDDDYFNNFEKIDFENDNNIKYKISFEKIMRMYKNAVENGFASYAEA
ncbi:McrB family protein [Psychroserpens burtonensis]|uniref:McrB family protein n=1 Tax=Psychroserpens burtonensis TaxID=49278 RepID=UPI000686C9FF|nr:ATP-binding protein [Psychroserpens burtonensis]